MSFRFIRGSDDYFFVWECKNPEDPDNFMLKPAAEQLKIRYDLIEKEYFRAMSKVYKECFEVLKKGGLTAVVVRPLARNKSVFDLPYQTWLILQKVGFRLVDLYTIEIPRSLWANIYEEHYPLVAKIRRDYIIVVRKPRSPRNVPSRIMSKSAF